MRGNNFDFLRFFLASLVLLSHCWPLAAGDTSNLGEPLMRFSGGQLTMGAFAVDAFFVVSGLLISQSWTRSRGFVDFVRRRVRRIYPGFLAMSFVTASLIVPAFAEHLRRYTLRGVGVLTLDALDLVGYGYPYGAGLHAFVHNPLPLSINGALWTVRYEFVCYVALALASWSGAFRHRAVPLLAFAVALVLNCCTFGSAPHPVLTALVGEIHVWPRFASYFLAGVVWHRYQVEARGAFTVAASCLTLLAFRFGFALQVLPLTLPVVLFWLADRPGPLTRFGARGDFSYGMYIYGFQIQQMVVALIPGVSIGALFALSFPATVVGGSPVRRVSNPAAIDGPLAAASRAEQGSPLP